MRYLIRQYNAVCTVTANTENPAHPAANLIRETRRLRWEAASASWQAVTLGVEIMAGSYPVPPIPGSGGSADTTYTDVVLSGVVADQVSLEVYVAGSWPTTRTPTGLVTTTYLDPASNTKTWWFSFPSDQQPGGTFGGFVLTAAKAPETVPVLSATNLFVGHSGQLLGVRYPLDEQLESTSISIQLADGSLYSKFRPSLRTFSGEALAARADISAFMRDAAIILGRPTAFHLAEGLDDQFYVQAQFSQPPAASHALPTLSTARFWLREVI